MSCELHRYHWPRPRMTEDHHVVPRAWQAIWRPPSNRGGNLWVEDTIELCPTGHRNVHRCLVLVMKTFASLDKGIPDAERLAIASKQTRLEMGWGGEFDTAMIAPRTWLQNRGSLQLLIDQRQYGYGMSDVQYGNTRWA